MSLTYTCTHVLNHEKKYAQVSSVVINTLTWWDEAVLPTWLNYYRNMSKYTMYPGYQLICMQLILIVFRHGKTMAAYCECGQRVNSRKTHVYCWFICHKCPVASYSNNPLVILSMQKTKVAKGLVNLSPFLDLIFFQSWLCFWIEHW